MLYYFSLLSASLKMFCFCRHVHIMLERVLHCSFIILARNLLKYTCEKSLCISLPPDVLTVCEVWPIHDTHNTGTDSVPHDETERYRRWRTEMWNVRGRKSMSGSDRTKNDMMWGLNTQVMERWGGTRWDGVWIFYLAVRRRGGEVHPRSPCDEWCCKNIYLKHSTVGHELQGREGAKGEEEESCDVLLSFLPSFLSLSRCFLLHCFLSDKVGQHYTSVQHTGGEEGEDLSWEINGEDGKEVRESAKRKRCCRERSITLTHREWNANGEVEGSVCRRLSRDGEWKGAWMKRQRLIHLYVSVGH